MKTVYEFLKNNVRDDTKDILLGVDRLMESLRENNIPHSISMINGEFNLTQYERDDPPTNKEINNEYHRQQGIAEFYNYLKNDQPEIFELLMRKLGYN